MKLIGTFICTYRLIIIISELIIDNISINLQAIWHATTASNCIRRFMIQLACTLSLQCAEIWNSESVMDLEVTSIEG